VERSVRLAATLAALLSASAVEAQIVNVQPLLMHDAHPGASMAFEAAADYRTGNVDLLLVSSSLIARYLRGRHLVFLLGREEFGMKTGQRFIDKDLEHLRYRLHAAGLLDVETFAQHDRDEFRRLALRVLWGAGPRLRVPSPRNVEAAVAAAYMIEYEELRAGTEPDAGQTTLSHRLSTYATVWVQAGAHLKLGHTVYVQPRWDRFSDVRVLSETESLIAVGGHVALKVSLMLTFDSQPPVGVKPLDVGTRTSLQVSF
jgi:hypothetical protein